MRDAEDARRYWKEMSSELLLILFSIRKMVLFQEEVIFVQRKTALNWESA